MSSFEEALAAARAELAEEVAAKVEERLLRRLEASGALAPPRRWLSTKEAAEYLGIDEDTLGAAARRGEVRSEQATPGAKRWFEPEALDEYRRGHARTREAA